MTFEKICDTCGNAFLARTGTQSTATPSTGAMWSLRDKVENEGECLMKRLTFEGNFCDLAMCRENPCPYNGSCSQKEVWERLRSIEDILGEEYDLENIGGSE